MLAINDIAQSDQKKRSLILLSAIAFPLLFTLICFCFFYAIGVIKIEKSIGNQSVYGEITAPINRAKLNKNFEIEGKTFVLPKDKFLYLVEQRQSLSWPKKKLKLISTNFMIPFKSHAPDNQFFKLSLVMVGEKGHQQLQQWFKTSHETKKYPGIKTLIDAEVVAQVKVKTHE